MEKGDTFLCAPISRDLEFAPETTAQVVGMCHLCRGTIFFWYCFPIFSYDFLSYQYVQGNRNNHKETTANKVTGKKHVSNRLRAAGIPLMRNNLIWTSCYTLKTPGSDLTRKGSHLAIPISGSDPTRKPGQTDPESESSEIHFCTAGNHPITPMVTQSVKKSHVLLQFTPPCPQSSAI